MIEMIEKEDAEVVVRKEGMYSDHTLSFGQSHSSSF